MSAPNTGSWNETHQGLEVAHPSDPLGNTGSDKVVVQTTPDKNLAFPNDPLGVYGPGKSDGVPVENWNGYGGALPALPQKPWYRRRKWLIIAGFVLLIAIVAAVVGAVLGTKKPRTSTSTASSTTTSTSPTATPTSTSTADMFHYTGNIAAASFAWNGTGGTRVYYQDTKGELVEASTKDNKTWKNTKLNVFPQNGSALAAAVSRPGYDIEITVLYTASSGIVQDLVYTQSGGWTQGTLSGQNCIAASTSRLSALYNQCGTCANTVMILYQDKSGTVQFGNRTSTTSWSLTSLSLSALVGTGLALQGPEAYGSTENQINLFHQKATNTLAMASWKEAAISNGVPTWNPTDQSYYPASPGTPIAAVCSNDYVYDSGAKPHTAWIQMLSLSSTGIVTDTWQGGPDSWLAHDVSVAVMSNSTGTSRSFNEVAVTSQGLAFAVVSATGQNDTIESWSVGSDLTTWKAIGNVDTGSSWT